MNAPAIQATVGADLSPLRAAGDEAGKIGGEIGDKLEHRLFGARHLSGALATALGLNLEKIGETIARVFTGMSKDVEKSMEEMVKSSDATLEHFNKMIEARRGLSQEGEREKQLIAERAAIFSALAKRQDEQDKTYEKARLTRWGSSHKIKLDLTKEEEAALQKNTEEMAAYTEEKQKRDIEARKKIGELDQQIFEKNLRLMPIGSQIVTLKEREAELEKQIAEFKGPGFELDIKKSQLEKTVALEKETAAAKQADWDKKQIEALEIIDQHKFDALSTEDKLAKYAQVRALLEREINDHRTTAQMKASDLKELDEIDKKVRELTLPIEKEITAEKEAQEKAAAKATADAEAQAKIAQTIKTIGRGDQQLSDRELQRKIGNLRRSVQQSQQNAFFAPGDFANPGGSDPFAGVQQINLQQAVSEMKFRQQVRTVANSAGQDAAFNQFSGLSEQRFNEILGSVDTNKAVLGELKTLNQNLLTGKAKIQTSSLGN